MRILIVDRQPAFAYGLAAILCREDDFCAPTVALSVDDARRALERTPFDVLALGLRVPGGAAKLCEEARVRCRSVRAAIFLEPGDGPVLKACQREIASVVLLRDAPVEEIIGVLRGLACGVTASRPAAHTPGVSPLSARQRRILELLGSGLNSSEVALVLGLAPNTVRSYCQDILRTLGARNRAHALELARARGLLVGAAAEPRDYLPLQVS